MEFAEKITGEKIKETLLWVHQNNTFIEARFPHSDDGELTIISDIKTQKDDIYLVFEKPRHLTTALSGKKSESVEFQYTGTDNILHTFVVPNYILSSNEMWVKFPSEILRHQRRTAFRLDVPNGTRLIFEKNRTPYKIIVSNISLGGSFGTLLFFQKDTNDGIILQKEESLENLKLIVPALQDSKPVYIQKARLLRQKTNKTSGDQQYAIQFISINKQQEKLLTDIIYDLQRQYLKNRLRIET